MCAMKKIMLHNSRSFLSSIRCLVAVSEHTKPISQCSSCVHLFMIVRGAALFFFVTVIFVAKKIRLSGWHRFKATRHPFGPSILDT
jgi:hypothetical protein